MRIVFLLLGIFGFIVNSNAATTTITAADGVRYILDLENHTAEVTFKNGFSRSYSTSNYTLTDIVIPEKIIYQDEEYLVTSIGKDAFYNCLKLEHIQVPDNIVSIGEYAFYKCSNLLAFDFPEELTSIGTAAFLWCSKIERLVFPLKLTELPEIGFEYFYALNYLVIPPGISYIGNNCFYTPASINDKVICLNPIPVELDGYNVFSPNVWNGSKIYVPAGSVDAYKKLNGWNKARNLLPLTEAQGVSINGEENTVKVGEQIQLSVSLLPQDVTCTVVEWKVENPEIAKISQKGIVTGVAPGQTNIIAVTLDGSNLTAEYPVTVLADKKILPGDSNDNEIVTVADVITTAYYIAGLPTTGWNFENADVNGDKTISIADVTATTEIILNEASVFNQKRKAAGAGGMLSTLSGESLNDDSQPEIGVTLNGNTPFSAIQATLMVPEGIRLKEVVAGPGLSDHQVLFNEVSPGVVKVIIFSFNNAEFNIEDGPLFYIKADAPEAADNLRIVDIIASDASGNEYDLSFEDELNDRLSTGMETLKDGNVVIRRVADGIEVMNAEGHDIYVFRCTGETVATLKANSPIERIGLGSGLYIVKTADATAKVLLK